MTSTSSTCTFSGARGQDLAARLERPVGPLRGAALFAHCFTCGKDLRVERQLTAALTRQGFAVLSFDFAGLGRSGGEFADSSFTADVADLRAAADYLTETVTAPSLLVGHSLGGAAVLSVAPTLDGVRAVATIGAPADPGHVEHLLDGDLEAVRRDGSAPVTIAGRTFTVGRSFLEELEQGDPRERIAGFDGATLIMHAPRDELVGIDNAEILYHAARHPKSFVSLDDADHLVTDPDDATYVAAVIAAWAGRYLPAAEGRGESYEGAGVTARNTDGFLTTLDSRGSFLVADEPEDVGGTEQGPTPYDYLAMSLASCTAMTMRMYADRKDWQVGELAVEVSHERVHADDCVECEHTDGQSTGSTACCTCPGD
ncbi:bifunctional alpha/beta hydrolase/OsmC family protein [Nocardioides coralli]|uniref:bifunctional alpha/beta hydrolase/OsmC family protein n=1 Tax=Nocardioides coralli TaxID=2872154 RepID=UPI001CA3D8B8|nr:alpha/beta fold hydrolase [Nocardioides coralli]QZY29097.1 alpha/beta fold hydrolase [Nocardioides coralli]